MSSSKEEYEDQKSQTDQDEQESQEIDMRVMSMRLQLRMWRLQSKLAFLRNKGKDCAKAPGALGAKYLRVIAAKVTERKMHLTKLEAIDCGLDAKQKAPVSLFMESFKIYVLKQAIGVVGLITPWNYLLLMSVWKVAPSLTAGTCLRLADICREVGLPPGVLNVLTRLGLEAGAPLASHPNVDKADCVYWKLCHRKQGHDNYCSVGEGN
ncbi:unnamed protein product [Thlaspi arvense]|uniref:aminobutyraldehyde dehydrogenase n=1 Tax=Thlaspi arvense TaxID=13288 RepID=A0AAU9SB64_THLAR|nr:unnamed protein product [Thlaspi arvense]